MINLFLRLTLQRLWCNRTAKVVKIKKLSTIGQEFFCYFYLLSFRLTLKWGIEMRVILVCFESIFEIRLVFLELFLRCYRFIVVISK